MSSIDERVVELKFDNQQFESGVQTSLGTLDRLKNALNLGGATKGLEQVQAASRGFNLDNVANSVQTLTDRFSALGTIGGRVLENLTDRAVSMAGRLITAIPNQIITGGINRAHNIEQAKFQLEGLKIAWDDVKDSINEAVSGTAYGLDAAAMAASQLAASNVHLGDDMTTALRSISGVAAMTNSSYEEISRVFTQVAGNGRLMGDQLLQLSTRGLNAAATLGEALGKTEAEVRDMVSKGQIDFMTFAKAMDDAFGEHAKDANATFSGALSNVKASLSRIGEQFATPFFNNLKEVLAALLPVMKDIEARFKPISAGFAVVAERVKNVAVELLGMIHEAIKIRTVFTDYIDVFKQSEKNIESIKDKLKNVLGIQEKTTKETKNTAEAQEEFERLAKEVIDGKYGNGEERRKALEAEGLSYERIQNKVNELLGCEKRWQVAEEELTKTTKETTKATKEYVETPTDKLTNSLAGIGAAFHVITTFGSAAWEKVIKPFATWGITKVLDGVLSVTSAIGQKLVSLDGTLSKSDFFNKGFDKISGGFIKIKDGVGSFIKTVGNLSGVQKLSASLNRLYAAAKSLLKAGFDKIVNAFRGFGKSVTSVDPSRLQKVYNIIDSLAEKLSTFIDNLLNGTTAFNGFFDGFKNLTVGGVTEKFFSTVDSIKQTAQQFMTGGFLNGDLSGAFATNIGEGLKKGLANVFGKKNISKLQGINVGAGGLSGTLVESILGSDNKITKTIFDRGKNIINTIMKVFSGLNFDLIFKGIKTASLAYTGIQIGKFFNSLTKGVGSLKKIPDGINTVLSDLSSTLRTYEKTLKADILLKIAGAIAILAASLIALSFVDSSKLWEAVKVMGVLALGIVAVYGAISFIQSKTSKVGKAKDNAMTSIADSINAMTKSLKGVLKGAVFVEFGAGLMLIAGALVAITVALKIIAKLDVRSITSNIEAFIVVFGAMGAMAVAARVAGKAAAGFGVGMFAMVKAVEMMVGVIRKINELELDEATLRSKMDALMEMIITMGVVLAAGARFSGGGSAIKFGVGLIAVAGSMLLAVSALKAIAEIPEDELARANIVLNSVILSLSILVNGFSNLGDLKTGSIVGIGLIIAELVGSIYLLTTLDAGAVLTSTAALDSMMLSLTVLIGTLSAMSSVKNALVGVLTMGAILAELVAALYFMKQLDVTADLESVASLSLLALSMSAVIFALQAIPWTAGLRAAVGLGSFILGIGTVMYGIGALNTVVPNMQEFIETGIPVFEAVGTAIGGFIGNLVGAFIGGSITAELPVLADNLASFAEKIQPFANAMSELGSSGSAIKEGVSALTEAIVALTGAGIAQNNPITMLLGGGFGGTTDDGEMTGMLQSLDTLATGLKNFSEKVSQIDNLDDLPKVGEVLKSIASATGVMGNEGGFFAMLVGDNTLSNLANGLNDMAEPLKKFANSVLGVDYSGVEPAMDAVNLIANAANKIPNQGGALADWIGDNTLSQWGAELVAFAPALVLFSGIVGSGSYDGVASAANAVTQIAEAASNVPNQGGYLAAWIGDNTLSQWGAELVAFAPALVLFNGIVGSQNFDGIAPAMEALKEITSAAKTIQNEGGLAATIFGDNSFETFAPGLISLGDALSKLSAADISTESVKKTADAVEMLGGVGSSVKGGLGGIFTDLFGGNELKNLERFSEAIANFGEGVSKINVSHLSSLGEAMKGFVTSVEEAKSFNATTFEGLSHAINSFAEQAGGVEITSFNSGVLNKASAAKSAVLSVVNGALVAAKNRASAFKTTGATIATSFVLGLISKTSSATSAGRSLATAAKNGASGQTSTAYNLGADWGEGYVRGVNSKASAARKAGASLANATKAGNKNAQDSNSPSKVAKELGGFWGEGYVIGINSFASKAAAAGAGLVSAVSSTMERPFKMITDVLGADLDSDPIIRPVMDLSDIQNGVKSISSMMPNTMVNVAMATEGMNMSSRATNSDLLSAINALNKREMPKSGDTFNINGITYDDGSNVSDAVRSLVRAARIERRR